MIRWALLGPGRHAERNVVPQLKKAADTELAAVVSRDRARGEAFAQKYGVATVYTSVEEVLRDPRIDAIYDASPDGLHAQHAIAAASAGKHILVEKPLAISMETCAAAIAACRARGVQLGVVFNQRHEAAHQDARRRVLNGEIGEVKQVHVQIPIRLTPPPSGTVAPTTWRTDPKMRNGGVSASIGDHAYDTLAYISGQDIDQVSMFTNASSRDSSDDKVCGMILKLSKGAIGYAAASFATPFARRPFEIHGTTGTLIIENSFAYLTGGEDPTPTVTLVNGAGSSVQRWPASECFRLEIEQFNRAIKGEGEPMTPGADGLRILAIAEALRSAVKTSRVTKVSDFLPQT